MRNLFLILLVFLLPTKQGFFLGTKIYVADPSHGGSDANSGTISFPIATLSKLSTMVSGLGQSDTVFFYSGDTFTGELPVPGNGVTGNPVVYTTYNGSAKAVISGYSTALSSGGAWSGIGGGKYQASLNAGLTLDVVNIGGAFVPMGRTPNAGSYWNIDSHTNPDGHGDDFAYFPDHGGYTVTITSSSIAASWLGAFAYVRVNDYNLDRSPIVNQSGSTITLNTYNPNLLFDNWKFIIQGAEATLDQQNEWYYDKTNHLIKVYSSVNPATLGIKVSQYDYGMNITGSSGFHKHDITLKNLKFDGQDSIGVNIKYADNISILNCEFQFTGTNAIKGGLDLGPLGSTSNITIQDCNIHDIGNSGMDFRYANKFKIWHNTVTNCGVVLGMGLPNNQQRNGIAVEKPGNSDSVSIVGNIVTNTGYCGIRYQGQQLWLAYNKIRSFGLITTDAGGIYTSFGDEDGSTGNRKIYYNDIKGGYGGKIMEPTGTAPGGMPGIYGDDGTRYADYSYNVIDSVTRYGIYLHNNANITAKYNNIYRVFGDAGIGSEYDGLPPFVLTRNIDIEYNNIYTGTTPSAFYGVAPYNVLLYSITGNDYGSYGIINNNYYARSTTTDLIRAGGNVYNNLTAWRSAYGYDVNSTFQNVSSDSILTVTNPTLFYSLKTFTGKTLRDFQGNNYTDTLTLAPFQNKLLKEVTYIPNPGGGGGSGGGQITPNNFTVPKRRKNVTI